MGAIIYHASKEIVQFPEVRIAKFAKDFSWGVYCTKFLKQAERWALRTPTSPIVNYYEYDPTENLKVLRFDEMNDEWLDFIAFCRGGHTHSYDVVEGPMANDVIWNYVNDFVSGNMTRKQFWVMAEFRRPTHQISFHTLSALACLTYIKSENLNDR